MEWTTPVERIHGNWPGEIPTVYRWAYDYSNPAYEEDFKMQNVPDEDQEIELFETKKITSPSTSDEPVTERASFFTLIRDWFKPRIA